MVASLKIETSPFAQLTPSRSAMAVAKSLDRTRFLYAANAEHAESTDLRFASTVKIRKLRSVRPIRAIRVPKTANLVLEKAMPIHIASPDESQSLRYNIRKRIYPRGIKQPMKV